MIFGHRNPDTDSVTSAIAYAYLKNATGGEAQAYVLGELSAETRFVLETFKVEEPPLLRDVKIQLKDLKYDKHMPMKPTDSLYDAYSTMKKMRVQTVTIVDDEGRVIGLLTMKDIAMSLIGKDQTRITTTYKNILEALEGTRVNCAHETIKGNVRVIAYPLEKLKDLNIIDSSSIAIVGDRLDIIDFLLEKRVEAIIVTGTTEVEKHFLERAQANGISVIATEMDTYNTAKNIFLTNYLKEEMIVDVEVFYEEDTLAERLRFIKESPHSRFPLINEYGHYLGLIGRKDFLSPTRKRVVLVDHNEAEQSAVGIEEAQIVEVIDHHRIGNIRTDEPILYYCWPVGSTNTIVYGMYRDRGISVPWDMAGLMLSGILSDTLILTSPTTTRVDVEAAEALAAICNVDLEQYGKEMFKAGSLTRDRSAEELCLADYKEFDIDDSPVGVAQVFTLDIEDLLSRKEEIVSFLTEYNETRVRGLFVLAATDILKQGSYLFFNEGMEGDLSVIFDREIRQGTFFEGFVSRKKQLIPALTRGIRLLHAR